MFKNKKKTNKKIAIILILLSGIIYLSGLYFSENKKEVFLEFTEHGGPPGILRPGAQGTVNVFTKAIIIDTLRFVLTH